MVNSSLSVVNTSTRVSCRDLRHTLRISDICCLLTPHSADELGSFSPIPNRKIIERTDRLSLKDKMMVNEHSSC